RRRPSTQVRGSKTLWVAAAFVNFVGPIAYFTFGRRAERRRPDEA
ncbi:MAG TPA: PLD nuclease N-terminal domain-containing protein, partial [Actinomycetota bacterium]|nr:PLD nuclease N-terminal domain-containing protein [Actinomycetota bacterium]